MKEDIIRENFEAGKNQGYTHMFILKDIFSDEFKYFYVLEGYDVDEEVDHLTCVDTYRLVAIFNYKTPIDTQIHEYKAMQRQKDCMSLKYIR